jgi:hypothetical protein
MLTMHNNITLVINEACKGFEQSGLAGTVGADNSD